MYVIIANGNIPDENIETLCNKLILLIKEARNAVYRNINKAEVVTNSSIGSWIVEVEQQGSDRAKYESRVQPLRPYALQY